MKNNIPQTSIIMKKFILKNIFIISIITLISSQVFADVIINELSAATSDRNLNYEGDFPKVGPAISWIERDFDDSNWKSGACPIGFGVGGLVTEVNIQGKALTYYVRQKFILSAADAAKTNDLHLHIDYDDGFIAFVNGKEIGRKNMGPRGAFAYHDQISYNGVMAGAKDIYRHNASAFLVEGTNVIAVQVHNNHIDNPGMIVSPDLYINGSPETQIVNHSDVWKYFVGYYEPSGGLVDPRLVGDETNFVATAWRFADFDDNLWSKGPGGLGYGDGDDETVVNIQNVAWSLYIRQTFLAEQTNAALILSVDYDDAFIAYLNGYEIARRNIGTNGEATAHNRPADGLHEAGSFENITLTNAGIYLVDGTNILAVQTHNANFGSSDMTIKANLAVDGASENLVYYTNIWTYFIGKTEPTENPNQNEQFDDDFLDWVELYNNGPTTVYLNGWSLTDDEDDSDKWIFPDVSIGSGDFLVILCSGNSFKEPPFSHLQTNFKLSKEGEFLGLYDNSSPRNFISGCSPEYPEQSFFHSYGWNSASNSYLYFSISTPGAPNTGKTFQGIVKPPVFDKNPGFYPHTVTVTITTATQNAEIRYTTNGSEPSETSALYTNALTFDITTPLRARAFKSNFIPSKTVTRTYILNAYYFVTNVPVISIVGDTQKSLFKSNGITAVIGGQWAGQWNLWEPLTPDDYHIPSMVGRVSERPASVEFLNYEDGSWKQVDCGIRIAGTGRRQYQLQNMDGRWDQWTYINKPQLNLFFRSDYGDSILKFPAIPDFDVTKFDSIRLRAGKNDWKNPFVNDEFARRTLVNMGQKGSKGFVAWLYVNGDRKAYYNPVQRYDEKFFQEAYNSKEEWDIINQDWYMMGHNNIVEGDGIAWDDFLYFINNTDMSSLANYAEAMRQIDVTNFVDYLIVETYSGNWDWPNNNWFAARERTSNAVFRFYIWDGEGCFTTSIDTDNFNEYPPWRPDGGYGLNGEDCPVAQIYRSLKVSAEFRQLFADRIQKHFFNGGVMTTNELTKKWNELASVVSIMCDSFYGETLNERTKDVWIPDRPSYIFQQYKNENLWSDYKAPVIVPHGGNVTSGFSVAIHDPNFAGTIYYTTDGSDPRAFGGTIVGAQYSSPITITKTTTIKARVYDAGPDAFSPLCEATFVVTGQQVIVVSEMMYHPPAGEEFEFIELQNTSGDSLNITNLIFTDGITFSFAESPVKELQKDEFVVVVKSNIAFAQIYNTNNILIAGEYEGKLANGGERIELQNSSGESIVAFVYSDDWYPTTDGDGFSLVLSDPFGATNLWNVKEGWRASYFTNGSPGRADVPEPNILFLIIAIISAVKLKKS